MPYVYQKIEKRKTAHKTPRRATNSDMGENEMTIDKIGKCATCGRMEFLNRDGYCEFDVPTAEWLGSSNMLLAATPHAVDNSDDKPEAA